MRLTKKRNDKLYPYVYADIDDCFQGTPINKLGQLEDVEEKLGLELLTVLRAFEGIYYIKNGKIKFACHLALVDWCFYVLDEGPVDGIKGFSLGLTDYGKTWALTKKELEK